MNGKKNSEKKTGNAVTLGTLPSLEKLASPGIGRADVGLAANPRTQMLLVDLGLDARRGQETARWRFMTTLR